MFNKRDKNYNRNSLAFLQSDPTIQQGAIISNKH